MVNGLVGLHGTYENEVYYVLYIHKSRIKNQTFYYSKIGKKI